MISIRHQVILTVLTIVVCLHFVDCLGHKRQWNVNEMNNENIFNRKMGLIGKLLNDVDQSGLHNYPNVICFFFYLRFSTGKRSIEGNSSFKRKLALIRASLRPNIDGLIQQL